jgi:hypothetical protein
LFTPALEKSGAVVGIDGDCSLVEDHFAVVVAEFPDAHEVVLEGWHDFGSANGEVKEDVGLS